MSLRRLHTPQDSEPTDHPQTAHSFPIARPNEAQAQLNEQHGPHPGQPT